MWKHIKKIVTAATKYAHLCMPWDLTDEEYMEEIKRRIRSEQ